AWVDHLILVILSSFVIGNSGFSRWEELLDWVSAPGFWRRWGNRVEADQRAGGDSFDGTGRDDLRRGSGYCACIPHLRRAGPCCVGGPPGWEYRSVRRWGGRC